MNSSVAADTERSAILAPHREALVRSRANLFRYINFGVALCIVSVLGGGCIFSPDQDNKKKPPPPVTYPVRDTPTNAILFYQKAWENKDSVQVAVVYADDYTGSSVDLTDPSATTLNFVKSDEVRSVGWLALNQKITFLEMEFYSPYQWQPIQYPNDPSDWVTLQIPHFRIEVRDVDSNGFLANSDDASGVTWIVEFTLKPISQPAGPPLWEIVRWTESRANL